MTMSGSFFIVGLFLSTILLVSSQEDDIFDVGVGISDITGPVAEVELWGYATMKQPGRGIHIRTYSRAFIIGKNDTRVVHVTTDLGSVSEILKVKVIEQLQTKYGNLYTLENVILTAIHTHSAPGGYNQFALYAIPAQGFIQQAFDAALEGIVKSIEIAHDSLQKGHLYYNTGELLNTSINRSPTAYLNNPKEEKDKYEYDVDKKMRVLKITDLNGSPLGAITWFAVHPTSMNNTNRLVSSDNKGYASLLFENKLNGRDSLPGLGPFVAAFPQAAHGDVSPNTLGPHCIDTGLPCDLDTSSCNGKSDKCIASGPGKDMFESTKIIGENQFNKAYELFNSASEQLSGDVEFIHQHVDMSKVIVPNKKGELESTCSSALGYSFAAGTTDGPGMGVFTQGTKSGSPFWNFIRAFIKMPSTKLKNCQSPKPILIATGEMSFPYDWQPKVVPTQIVKIGKLTLVPVPGEFTTMSGRRLADAVEKIFKEQSPDEPTEAIVQSLSNDYSSYIATFEEFQVQRYEGASTIYGPNTLQAYIEQYSNLAKSLIKRQRVDSGPDQPNLLSKQINLQPGVVFDTAGFGKNFGQVTLQPLDKYKPGETVNVEFVSGHPRNNLQLGNTYLTIERLDSETKWVIVATDANWETKFHWKRSNAILGTSRVTVQWEIPEYIPSGSYRVQHFGHSKSILQKIKPYTGTSKSFKVVA